MSAIDQEGQLHTIRTRVEKDWEVGAICRENHDRNGPAVVFNQVDNHKTPLVVGVLGTRERYMMALEIEPSLEALSQKWKKAYKETIKPRTVKDAPCKEVVLDGVNLFEDPFPVPKWHPLDAGPELGTLHTVITQDPETGWINCGTYRCQIMDPKTLGCYVIFAPYRHVRIHWDKWKKLGKPMPVAIALGLDPYLSLTSVSAVPIGVDEYDVAGGLKGSPLEVIEAEDSDLLVPAQAEIILEGEMPTDSFLPEEGPFGEFPGYMGQPVKNSHYIVVKKVTSRKDPLFQGTYEGRPPNESTTVRSIGRSMAVMEHLRRVGIQWVKDVCVTPSGCAGFHAVVSIKKSYPGHVRDVMVNVWGHPTLFCKHVFVVDEDIDPWNPSLVEWAIATRVQASRDIEIVRDGKSIELDPSQVASRRGYSDLLGVDATMPVEEYRREGNEFPAFTDPLPEEIEKVRAKWEEYGFKN